MKIKAILAVCVVLAAGVGIYVWQADSGTQETSLASSVNAPAGASFAPAADQSQAAMLRNTAQMKPPVGAKVAIVEFDDLECPYCSRAVPILRAAGVRYRIPLVHHDFPLWEIHTWSTEAAVTARYLADKVSAPAAEQYRHDVFAHQNDISNKDDLDRYTKSWFSQNRQVMPFVLDSSGDCRREVQADRALGESMGIHSTPCIFVVTEHTQTYVANLDELSRIIDRALAEGGRSVVEVPAVAQRESGSSAVSL